MTGLDPIGRKEIRDLILELRAEGKTVFFSTHILSDVETTCDRVAIVVAGRLRSVGPLSALLSTRLLSTEVVVRAGGAAPLGAPGALGALPAFPEGTRLLSRAPGAGSAGDTVALDLPAGVDVDGFLRAVLGLGHGVSVLSVMPRRESLEDLFVREAATPEREATPPKNKATPS
jgi:ABC-2 type transport system ATP-binding protein